VKNRRKAKVPRWARSVHNSAACETCNFILTENHDATRLCPICRSSAHTGGLFLIRPRGEWGRLFEHRPECRRELGRPWVR